MAIVHDEVDLKTYIQAAAQVSPHHPLYVDQFLNGAIEVDVDAICDGRQVVIGGIMQHVEGAGVHSGDSACVLPPHRLSANVLALLRSHTHRLGMALHVRGLMNVQYAIQGDQVYVLEVNPRASRTVPYVSKATGVQLAKIAAKVMLGSTLEELGLTEEPTVSGFFVKEAVLPWKKFTGVDTILGPEMRSTGEVMGHAPDFGNAFAKSQEQAGSPLPVRGGALLTVNDQDKPDALSIARELHVLGFRLLATQGTAAFFRAAGLEVQQVRKAGEEGRTVIEAMQDGQVDLVVNTPKGPRSRRHGARIRALATRLAIPILTTMPAAAAAVTGIRALQEQDADVRSLQNYAMAEPVP